MRMLTLSLCISSLLLAQAPPGGALRQRPGRGAQEPSILAEIQQHHADRIKQTVGVSEEKARQLAARWTKFLRESAQRGREIHQLRRQFDELLRAPGSEEEKNQKLKPLLEQFTTLRNQQIDLRRAFEEDVRSSLSPAQQVRMILMIEDLQRDLQEGMKQALRRGRRQGGGE